MRVKIDAHATSIAIIYAKSVNEQYGCALSSLNDLSSKDTQYYDKKGIIRHLEKIRQQAENNRMSPNSILRASLKTPVQNEENMI